MKRQTYKQARIIMRIESTASLLRRKADDLVALVNELDEHVANRIAAHKAHHTMKKRTISNMERVCTGREVEE